MSGKDAKQLMTGEGQSDDPSRVSNPSSRQYFSTQRYWNNRSDLLYYQYIDLIVRTVAARADSLLDVGSGNCPYLEWFDWIPRRVSVDIRAPYKSAMVEGIRGDIHELDFERRFDVVTCLQVLEHVPDAERFARRLLELAPTVIVSVPHIWPAIPPVTGHVHDPVDYDKLCGWMGRPANYHQVVHEPFVDKHSGRLIAIYLSDPCQRISRADYAARRHRPAIKPPTEESLVS